MPQQEKRPARRWRFWCNVVALGLGVCVVLLGFGFIYLAMTHTTPNHSRGRKAQKELRERMQNLPAAEKRISAGMERDQVLEFIGHPEETEDLLDEFGPKDVVEVLIYKRRGRTRRVFLHSPGAVV